MAISLAALLGVNSLKLSKAGVAETTWHQDINWVAVTELEDPQRFLNGGELILTTGLRLKSAPEQRRFVRQVQRAGAVGIGFGVGLSHDAVPPALLAEANRWGLPVVEVPYETPFIAITKLVADAQSADHYSKLERLIAGHQILARALLTGGGLAELLKQLGSMLRTDIALTQFTAQLYNSSTATPAADSWSSFPIPTGRRDACTLWVRQPFEDTGIVGYAQNLISVELNNMVKQRQAQRALCGQVLEDVIHGALETSEAQRRLAGVGINSTRKNVVLLAVSPAHHKALGSTSVPRALEGAVAAVVGKDLVVVINDDGGAAPALARQLSDHLAEAGIHATIGIGGAYTKPNGLRWSYFEARDAAGHGLPVNEPERLSLTSLLLASEDVPLADMAHESLNPLRAFDAAHGAELMTTLESYLTNNGSVAAVAEQLTLHRNTVRYRLAQITELTGYDPSVTPDRVQLWLALAVARLSARQGK
ncbi:PucR family transcriptional regulator ligand-binding domain-containing protein [Pseudarthrobacter sp. SL88]|uniref:PucR family transcriptional regulator n=1 Tax=Pseudarthrobacter TaxID=1742993 RepID=UPI0021BEA520|nr:MULTISPECIES: PucR family transcriptional regulator [Pseudarthrobacter]MCT9624645.1 PucR family transcriptional regulator ligand-binding domain-containing protein [Pseudarthrobacter equi]MCY1673915.1 PucR family transcriptional regulator ligand-binding domain-containing protein [Pseudarthrobacter sp. SL88]MDQ1055088.1 purine catabolism regulator [Arthrobacter sp. SORGH_AS_0212]